MAVPTFSMRQLLEAGVHFGHQTIAGTPHGVRISTASATGFHIIDLQQTVPLLYRALDAVRATVAEGGRVLFVGTKRQARQPVAEAAKRCGQYYVNHRWLGGMLTNWRTISNSIGRLRKLDEQLEAETTGLTKKETLNLTRERDKLERTLGGIREMGGLPNLVFVIDTNQEEIAKQESIKLGIPLFAVVDSNSDPAGVQLPVPGNDDFHAGDRVLLRPGGARGARRVAAGTGVARRRCRRGVGHGRGGAGRGARCRRARGSARRNPAPGRARRRTRPEAAIVEKTDG